MPRFLQLIDTTASYDAISATDQLVARLGSDVTVERRAIGRGGHYRSALQAMQQLRREPFDLIHAWSPAALLAAAMAGSARLVFTPPLQRLMRTIHLLRAVMAYRQVEVVVPSATLDRMLIQRGVAPEHCHLIRPGVDFAQVQRRKNPALRQALGLAPDTIVILAVGESTAPAGHDKAAWAASILHSINPRFRLILWGRGDAIARVAHLAASLEPDLLSVVAERRLRRPVELGELLSVANIALITATGIVSPLSIAMTMAAGVPIVSTATYATSELLEDRHTALMPPKPQARLIARRVLELQDDPGLQWRLADVARTEAYEHFSISRFLDQHRILYRQLLAGDPVKLEQPQPGAGSRFHGRA